MELNGIDTYSSERLAALVWSYVTPGADARAYRAVAQWGYAESLERLRRADSAIAEIVGESSTAWRRRLELFDTEGAAVAQLRALKRLGAWVITPEDPLWPEGMNALGERAPLALWVRGHKAVAERILGGSGLRSISIVGARAASARGVRTAVNFSYELARDYVITSGGAFGIDVAAHKGALAAGGHTVIFSAAGVDRIYPTSHAPLFQQVWNGGGLVISEFGLGTAPHAHRFLLRNRLIAAFSRATVVVEAPIRSGALSTARAALEIGRPVGAVPGLIDAPQSAGCHELIRHNGTLVASVAHIRELASPIGEQLSLVNHTGSAGFEVDDGGVLAGGRTGKHAAGVAPSLGVRAQVVFDAVPKKSPAALESIARVAGMSIEATRAELGKLALKALVERRAGLWVKSV